MVAINYKHRDLNFTIALLSLIPLVGMPDEIKEGAIVTWSQSRSKDLRTEAWCDRFGGGDATFEDTLLNELVAQAHDGFPEHWHPGEVKG